ncbi:MAG: AI-2E family transporter [Kiritimatiellae bacterium]|nr:AI-2E family transporter [Kiritimatiellia bacterium]MDW8458377.1 AI-2E family transporter [Verrucomicrobiota bacterium]
MSSGADSESTIPFRFGPRQQAAIAAALTLLAVAAITFVLFHLFRLLVKFVVFFSPVISPLAAAAILSVILKPAYDLLLGRVRYPWLAATLLFAVLGATVLAVLWAFGTMAMTQVRMLAEQLPRWVDVVVDRVEVWLPWLSEIWAKEGDEVRSELREHGGWIAERLWGAARGAAEAGAGLFGRIAGLAGWMAFPVYVFFMLTGTGFSVDSLRGLLPFLKEETREDVIYLCREFAAILVAFFRGQIVIALAQALLFAAGFSMVGLQFGIAIGLTLGLLNVVPYLGNVVGLAVAIPLALFQPGGGWLLLASVLAVFAVVQLLEGYVLTPRIMGRRTGLHPAAVIFSLFFWGTAFDGVLGMILGIPLTAFLVVFWRLLKAKYLKPMI